MEYPPSRPFVRRTPDLAGIRDDAARAPRVRLLRRLSRDRLKDEVIAAYGGKCAECPERRPECLQIDHVDSDAIYQVRRGRPRGGARLYARLRREGWPRDKYQLLCANCNLVKAMRLRREQVRDEADLPEYPVERERPS